MLGFPCRTVESAAPTNPSAEGKATAVYLAATQTPWGQSHPPRHGHPRRQRNLIHRRDHDAQGDGWLE
jgi:hypothetical protein